MACGSMAILKRFERIWNQRIARHRAGVIGIDDDREDEFATLDLPETLRRFVPLQPEVSFSAMFCIVRQQRQEKAATLDGAAKLLVPVVPWLQRTLVKPGHIATNLLNV